MLSPPKALSQAMLQVFDMSRPGKEAQKLSRDTSNPTMLGKERRLGL